MKRIILAGVTACAALAAVLATGAPAAADPGLGSVGSTVHQELALARSASAAFHDVDAAIAAGYVPTDTCTELPGVGAMGYHYINPANISDGVFDPAKPDILLFVPGEDGALRLGGVEFFKADADQNLATDTDRPSMFGQPFNGPMPGHEAGMPIHYDLHVWLWVHNPNGLFAPWNPTVSCPGAGV